MNTKNTPSPVRNQREVEITNLLRNEHGRRENNISENLRLTRNPEKYLEDLDYEENRYTEVVKSVEKYFKEIM